MQFLTLLRKAGILEAELAIVDSVMVRAFGGGDATGPSPVDRRKLGTKHTLVMGERQRREFSKLVVAARMLEAFAIICGVSATLNAGGALMMVVGEPTNAVMGVREAWVVVVVGLAFAVLLRAAAEFIRLAIYAVELLEDIRNSRA